MSDAIAGVVVLYHPDETVEDNIRSYLPQVNLLVVVDNSPSISAALKDFIVSSEKILYLGGGVNRGIATALNLGAEKALQLECDWLLTMDQDSRFEPGALESLIRAARNQTGAGIVSPLHVLNGKSDNGNSTDGKKISHVMMSGNLLNLKAYKDVGPFLEKLFIDYVDYEYCLRLQKAEYSIYVMPAARLRHALGKIEPRRFLGLAFHPTHHSPMRKYYTTRNRLYVMKTYPAFIPGEIWAWAKEIVKLLAFERQRFSKFQFMAKGVADFLSNRYGPLSPGKQRAKGI